MGTLKVQLQFSFENVDFLDSVVELFSVWDVEYAVTVTIPGFFFLEETQGSMQQRLYWLR